MNWLLIVILIIFLLLIIHGWKKGLLRILFSLIAIVVLIGLISYATPYVSGFLKEHTGIYTMIEDHCAEQIQSQIESGLEGEIESDFPEGGIALPQKIAAYLMEGSESALENSGVYESLGEKAADLVLAGVSFFVALILAIIIVKLIDKGLGIVDHIPVLKGINRMLGLFAGAFEAFILVSLLLLFVALIAGTELGGILIGYVKDSRVLSFLYYNNILQNLFLY